MLSRPITPVLHKDMILISGLDLGGAAIRPAKRDGKFKTYTVAGSATSAQPAQS